MNTLLISIIYIIVCLYVVDSTIKFYQRKKRKQQDKEQEVKLESELRSLCLTMKTDWDINKDPSKLTTFDLGFDIKLYRYNLNVDVTIELYVSTTYIGDDKLKHIIRNPYSETTYNLGGIYFYHDFINLLIDIIKLNKSTSNDKDTKHPKWDRYWGLILNIRQRTKNLETLSNEDPNRGGLINELNTAKRQAKIMKEKYNF